MMGQPYRGGYLSQMQLMQEAYQSQVQAQRVSVLGSMHYPDASLTQLATMVRVTRPSKLAAVLDEIGEERALIAKLGYEGFRRHKYGPPIPDILPESPTGSIIS